MGTYIYMKQERLQHIINELTRLDAELLDGDIAYGPNGELLTITDDEGWVIDDNALARISERAIYKT